MDEQNNEDQWALWVSEPAMDSEYLKAGQQLEAEEEDRENNSQLVDKLAYRKFTACK